VFQQKSPRIREEEEEQRRLQQQAKREEERRKEESKRQQQKKAEAGKDSPGKPKSINSRGGIPGGTTSRPRPKKELTRREPTSILGRFGAIISNLQALILTTTQSLTSNPLLLLRTVLFIFVFAMAFGRRRMRARIQRALQQAWFKIKGTVGMGMKVSSI